MTDIKLFVSTHKADVHIPKIKILYPIQVGSACVHSHFPGMLHDDSGDNISVLNPQYCELTGQYWAWKNAAADYFGFMHYRRYFNFSDREFPISHEPFVFGEVVRPRNGYSELQEIGFNANRMREIIESVDLIAPTPVASPTNETVYEQYVGSVGHHKEDIDAVADIVKRISPEIVPAMEEYFNSREIYCCNMFVMRDQLFQDYSEWLFAVLKEHLNIRDISDYPEVDRRVSGYLAERLCGVYITYLINSGIVYRHLQRVYFRDVSKHLLEF